MLILQRVRRSSYLIDFILWWAIRQHQDCWYLQIKCIVSRVTSDVVRMDIFCFNSYSEGREVSIIRIPRHCLYAPLVWKFLKKLFYSLWYCWLGLAPEFVLKLLAAPRFSTSCIFWKYEVKKKKTFILHLPHSISECQSGNEASTRPSAIKATTNQSMLFWIRH